jgi:hypothetical protein
MSDEGSIEVNTKQCGTTIEIKSVKGFEKAEVLGLCWMELSRSKTKAHEDVFALRREKS